MYFFGHGEGLITCQFMIRRRGRQPHFKRRPRGRDPVTLASPSPSLSPSSPAGGATTTGAATAAADVAAAAPAAKLAPLPPLRVTWGVRYCGWVTRVSARRYIQIACGATKLRPRANSINHDPLIWNYNHTGRLLAVYGTLLDAISFPINDSDCDINTEMMESFRAIICNHQRWIESINRSAIFLRLDIKPQSDPSSFDSINATIW